MNNYIPSHSYTIFAQFDNQFLKKELTNWAAENDCVIVWGKPLSPDIVAVGGFVEIIDRHLLGKEMYELYLKYLRGEDIPLEIEGIWKVADDGKHIEITEEQLAKEANEDIGCEEMTGVKWNDDVCIIIDNIKDLEVPQNKIVLYFDPSDERTVNFVLGAVQVAKKAKDKELRRNGFIR